MQQRRKMINLSYHLNELSWDASYLLLLIFQHTENNFRTPLTLHHKVLKMSSISRLLIILYNNMGYKANILRRKNENCFLAVTLLYCVLFEKNFFQFSSVCLHNICLAVLATAVRSSRRRQQYKNGLMDEFMNTAIRAKCHSLSQTFVESPRRVNNTYIGK